MSFSRKWLILILILSASYSFAQTKTLVLPSPTPPPAPGNIKLLPDYTHESKQGIDSAVGIISKKDGLTISYDIGRMAGNYVGSVYSREKPNLVWLKTQKINNQEVVILYLKNGNVYATFQDSNANFFATVKTDEELTDFLLMIMTYGSDDKPKTVSKTK
jgi:hypothetical protein